LSSLREEYSTLQELGAEVLAVSADSVESHSRFAEREGGFPFPLLSDPMLEAISAYEVIDEQAQKARRALFVVAQNGRVECAIPYYNPANSAQFLEVFQALGLRFD